jgi:hypothetical protein
LLAVVPHKFVLGAVIAEVRYLRGTQAGLAVEAAFLRSFRMGFLRFSTRPQPIWNGRPTLSSNTPTYHSEPPTHSSSRAPSGREPLTYL